MDETQPTRDLRAIAGLAASRLYVAGAGFAASVLWVHTFDKQTYGRYQLIIAATTVIASFCLTGLNDATLISSARKQDGNLASIVRLRLIAALLGALVIAGWGVLRYHDDDTMLLGFAFAALLFAPIQLQPIWQAFTNGKQRFRLLTTGQIALATASLAGVAAFTIAGASSPDALPWVILVSQGLLVAVGLWLHVTLRALVETTDRDPTIVRYGHHVTAASLLGWVFVSDRLIVGEVLDAGDVAILAVAILLPAQVKIFFSAFEQVFLPKVTAAESVRAAWIYMRPRLFRLWLAYTALGAVGFVVLPFAMPLVFPERYDEAIPYAQGLWLATCLSSPFTFLASILNSQRDTRFLYLKNLASPGITLALFAILIPPFGLDGAVAARIANAILLVGLHVGYFAYALKRSEPSR